MKYFTVSMNFEFFRMFHWIHKIFQTKDISMKIWDISNRECFNGYREIFQAKSFLMHLSKMSNEMFQWWNVSRMFQWWNVSRMKCLKDVSMMKCFNDEMFQWWNVSMMKCFNDVLVKNGKYLKRRMFRSMSEIFQTFHGFSEKFSIWNTSKHFKFIERSSIWDISCIHWNILYLRYFMYLLKYSPFQMENISDGEYLRWRISQMENISDGEYLKWRISQMENISDGEYLRWRISQMENISNGAFNVWNIWNISMYSMKHIFNEIFYIFNEIFSIWDIS